MNSNPVHIHQFDNGLTLICETMPWLESAAVSISVPSGCIYDPAGKVGLSNFTCEMVQRGCGQRDSRQFVEDLEWLGVNDSSSVNIFHSQYSGAMPARSLNEALAIYADMLQRPHLPEAQLEDGRLVCLQEIRSIEDDLSTRAVNELRMRYFGEPIGRNASGTLEAIQGIGIADIREFFEQAYRPNGMILSVAGKVDWQELCRTVEKHFAAWPARECEPAEPTEAQHGYHHIEFDSQQTQIVLAFDSIPYAHEDYFRARAAVGVLSGGYGSRLFTEVREKEGLCYSVGATLHSVVDRGFVLGYAGTSAERAQQTLDKMVEELERIGEGVSEDELDRVKVAIRSVLVMQQESSRSRAAANAGDWFLLGRVRSRDEINDLVQELTADQVNQYLANHRFAEFDLVTLGPQPLEYRRGISATTT